MFWVGGTLGGNRFIAPGIMVSGFWFLLRKRGWRRAALPRTFVAHGREACDAVESARLPRSRAETPWQPTWLPRASDADRRGRCLSCPSPERLSCERRALCECFKYLSPVNSVWIYSVGDRKKLYHNVGGAANARGDLEGTTRSWQGLIARYHTCRSVPRITRTRR